MQRSYNPVGDIVGDTTARIQSEKPFQMRNSEPRLILHVLPTFGVGGVQVRTAQIINHLGNAFRHIIITLDSNHACQSRLSSKAQAEFLPVPVKQKQTIKSIRAARSQLAKIRPDLLLTYNWGSIEWAFANMLRPLCPHVHFEDGFGPDETDEQLSRRVWFRRVALARTSHLVVPSRTLVNVATQIWKLAPSKVVHIPNGVDCSKFVQPSGASDMLETLRSGSGLIIGTVAPLRPEKNLGFLLESYAAIATNFDAKVVIVGDGAERPKLTQLAQMMGITDRVYFTGHEEAVETALTYFDVFALTSRTEQMPISILQAMAAAKPVAAVDVGDVKLMLSAENRPFVVPRDDPFAYREALARLLENASERTHIGAQNRAHVQKFYPQDRMLEAHRELLISSLGGAEPCGGNPAPAQEHHTEGTFTVSEG